MFLTVLHNADHDHLADDPGREARQDVLRVAAAMEQALRAHGHEVALVPVDASLTGLQAAFARRRPDVAINLCESLAGDSRGELVVPSLLELWGVPFTGNPAMALGLALHKHQAKDILQARGISTPAHRLVASLDELATIDLPFPLIVKPCREDASAGIDFDSVVHDRAALARAVEKVLRAFHQPAILEQYIEGREVAVPLLGNHPRRALPPTEVTFGAAFEGHPRIVSYGAKWHAQSPEYLDSPSAKAVLDEALHARCVAVALAAFEALECRDYGRVDLRVDAQGKPWVIDINPNCDLHPEAGFAKAAAAAGLGWAELALHLVELAKERSTHGHQAPRPAGPPAVGHAAGPHRDLHARRGRVRAGAHRRFPAAD